MEYGEEAQNDHDVVQVGDDGRQPELPFEAQCEVGNDTDRDKQQREPAVFDQFLADLRPDKLDPADFGRAVFLTQFVADLFG